MTKRLKIFLKRFTAAFTAAFVLCLSVVSSVSVSASSVNEVDYYSRGVVHGNPDDSLSSYVNYLIPALLSNSYIDEVGIDNITVIAYCYQGYPYLGFIDNNFLFNVSCSDQVFNISYDVKTRLYHGFNIDRTKLVVPSYITNTYDFVLNSKLVYKVTSATYMLFTDSNDNYYVTDFVDDSSVVRINYQLSDYVVFKPGVFSYIGPVKPDDIISDSHVYYGFPVGGINKKAFASWLVDEGKESVINSAGYSFTSKQIESLVDVWATYGYHPLSFLSSLTKTFNIVTQLKGSIALTQTINQLYRDYQEYLNTYELSKLDDPVNLPHWRTDKEDTSLITDTEADTTDISLLRAILRAVVHLPSDIAVHFNYVKTGFNDILFDFQNQINVMADLPDNIGVAVANNINPTLNSIDNSVNALAVPLTDIDTNVNAMAVGVADIDANVNAMAVGVADIDANLGDVNLSLEKIDDSVNTVNNSVNSVNGSVNNLDVSLHEINNTLNDGSGSGSGGCSGSRPCTPDLPEAEFDDLYEQSGDFFKFFRDLLDSSGWIPASLFTAACLVAIFMRVWGR